MEPLQHVEAKGVSIFQPPLPTSFRYVLQLKDDKLSISMEDNTSKKQWSKSDMVKEDYVTLANSIFDGSALDYLKCFQDALDCDMDKCGTVERQLELVQGGALRLSFAIQFRFLRSTRVAKYTFKLNPVADQIQDLESKLQSYEEELERLRNARQAFPFARFEASTTHPDTQKLLWNAVESDIFHVVDGTVTISQKGAYSVAVWFYINPRKAALLKNKTVQEEDWEPAALSSVMHLNEGDTVSVEYDGDVGGPCCLTIALLG